MTVLTMQRINSRSSGSRTPPTVSTLIPNESTPPVITARSISHTKSASTSSKSSKLHRPSLTSPMNWLGRSTSSSSSSQSQASAKQIRISEPQLQDDMMNTRRRGPLGAGATIVRTPQEALMSIKMQDAVSVRSLEMDIPEEDEVEDDTIAPSSPPLPPLPDVDDAGEQPEAEVQEDYDDYEEDEDMTRTLSSSRSSTPSRPTRPIPPVPVSEPSTPLNDSPTSSLRPSLKVLDNFPPVPALPANIPAAPAPPIFEPILLSGVPMGVMDTTKIIVAIETCTETFKVSLGTLCSRPSYLASYLQSLLPPPPSPDAASVYSRQSEVDGSFHSIFRNHLATSGLLPTSVSTIQIFLDRPSAPYTHILSYLRSSPSTPEQPAVLPRAVQLTSSSSSRLEALLDLRDEARYLDLTELYDLCCNELRTRHYHALSRPSQHTRDLSSASVSTGSGSLRSTLREIDEVQDEEPVMMQKPPRRLSKDSGVGSSCSSSSHGSQRTRSPAHSIIPEVGWHSPPPGSLLEHTKITVKKFASVRTRPAGDWI